jgi:molybdate-binding protein
VEAARSEPSLRLALALAEALGVTVDSLFGVETSLAPLHGTELAPVGVRGSRAALAAVGGRLVAAPLSGSTGVRSGFAPATALVTASPGTFQPLAPMRPTLVVAGCDPALPLLEAPLAHLDPPVSLLWRSCGSAAALELAASGLVHVAGFHTRELAGDERAVVTARLGPGPHEVVGFAGWREGLVLRPGLAALVTSLAEAVAAGLRLVNREPGAQARTVLEEGAAAAGVAVSACPGYSSEVPGHLEVAAAIASGLADFGVASEPAALAYGLDFVALSDERFDLVVAPGLTDAPEVQALVRVLGSPWLHRQLASIPGYDASTCGEVVAVGTSPS